jgi:hypothetical protein
VEFKRHGALDMNRNRPGKDNNIEFGKGSKVRNAKSLLNFSLSAGRLYTASHVFTEPGMQKPNSKSKLLIS